MNDPTEPNALLLLGEIRGQLRELIHTGNNNASKIDALAVRIGAVELMATKLETVEQLIVKVDSLERERNRRDGAFGLVEWFVKNWPAVIGFAVLLFVVLKANGQIP